MSTYLKPNIQLFAEGDPTPATPPPPSGGKTYTEDYVGRLRDEADGYRGTSKSYEAALRGVLGLKESEEIGDLNARLAAHKQTLEQQREATLQAANNRLVDAELRGLEGYDHKLLARLIDRSKIKVDEKGTVSGLKEAAEETAKEYPSVRTSVRQRYEPANPAATTPPTTENQIMNDLIRGRR